MRVGGTEGGKEEGRDGGRGRGREGASERVRATADKSGPGRRVRGQALIALPYCVAITRCCVTRTPALVACAYCALLQYQLHALIARCCGAAQRPCKGAYPLRCCVQLLRISLLHLLVAYALAAFTCCVYLIALTFCVYPYCIDPLRISLLH